MDFGLWRHGELKSINQNPGTTQPRPRRRNRPTSLPWRSSAGVNSPRDPFVRRVSVLAGGDRRFYWQCRMTQVFGSATARAWGNAHEKYQTDSYAARMDLHNNAVGRVLAAHYGSCEDAVRIARTNKLLMESKIPDPIRTQPDTPPPPPPNEPM